MFYLHVHLRLMSDTPIPFTHTTVNSTVHSNNQPQEQQSSTIGPFMNEVQVDGEYSKSIMMFMSSQCSLFKVKIMGDFSNLILISQHLNKKVNISPL